MPRYSIPDQSIGTLHMHVPVTDGYLGDAISAPARKCDTDLDLTVVGRTEPGYTWYTVPARHHCRGGGPAGLDKPDH